ncbi:AI-2E family transporter [Horticoccus sp. 23ND18S-11]|uniref:AI-2E family transporter n=1 Tax=Horticoccus sp. 23ND18S-11 TaxID=3391832 RepID=UPI0039C93493
MPAEPTPPLFSDSQQRVISSALTLLAFLGSIALLILAVYVMGRLLGFFSSVLWPLAVAGVLALILRPLVVTLERRLRLRRFTSVLLLYGVVVLLTAGGLLLLVPPLVNQVIDFISYLPELWERASAYVEVHYPDWIKLAQKHLANPSVRNIADSIASEGKALFALTVPSVKAAFGGLLDVGAFLTHLAIIPVYLFFFLLMRGAPTRSLDRHLPFLRPGVREDVVFLASEFVSIIESFFRGQILIGLCMGVLLAAGFTIIGLKFGLVIGLALGVLNIVPYLGTILGLAVSLPIAFFQPNGGWQLVGLVLLVKGIVQCVESWFLTPKIMGHHTGLHPVAIIVAVFFWGTAFGGVLGMLLAVPLTAFFVTVWRLMKRKYFTAEHA